MKNGARALVSPTLPIQILRENCALESQARYIHTRTHTAHTNLIFCSCRPPPVRIAHDTAAASSLWRQRERLGDLEAYEAPRKTDVLQWDVDTAGALEGTNALLDALGETNPILKDLLKTAKDEINVAAISTYNVAQEEAAAAAAASASSDSSGTTATTTTTTTTTPSYSGRRLMQRKEYNVRMTDALITAEIMTFYGSGGIPGVTSFSCEALCEATAQVDDAHPTARCRAFAFKRASPFSYVDQTGWCYLLQVRVLPPVHHTVALLTLDLACFRMREPVRLRTLAWNSTRVRSSRSASAAQARRGLTVRPMPLNATRVTALPLALTISRSTLRGAS